MKRSLIVLVLLSVVLTGVFAVSLGNPATATLNATIGEYFEHGFHTVEGLYQASVTKNNAFTTDPEFVYGYRTNGTGSFTFNMVVGDFVSGENSVKIAAVSASSPLTPASGGYTVFSFTGSGSDKIAETTITISPAQTTGGDDHTGAAIEEGHSVDSAPAGDYVSTITFSVISG
ncbi:hypothetical protein [Sphaerochaeta pleomorpha]|nr:hypothetical protein [Sphaerochaeta pleomorpha]